MATMYPELFPGQAGPGNPEYDTFQVLRKLPAQYHVFYSKRMGGGPEALREREIDFVISNLRDTVICLEVKGGVIEYNGVKDEWTQNGRRMDRGADRQARGACYALLRLLSKDVEKANVDWALCFPHCCLIDDVVPLGMDREQMIDERGMLDIAGSVLRLEQRMRRKFAKPGFSPEEARSFVEVLTRSIGFVRVLGVRIAHEAAQIVQITEEQCEVLRDVEVNPRMIVHGAAGTGKTILAQTFAQRMAARGQRVLLLFYNRGIAARVRYAFDRGSGVEVGTFASFAKRLVQQNDPEWWDSQGERGDEFWRLELPARLLYLSPSQLPAFDTIIVDEGQDFKPEWYEFLVGLLVPGDESHFVVFLDEHQDIFGHWKSFPCSPPPAKKVLVKNCRNTRSIVEYLNARYPTQMSCFDASPQGTPIVERVTKNDIDEQTQIVRDVKHLLEVDRVSPGSIVILLNSDKRDSCLKDTRAIAGLPLRSTYDRYDPASRAVYYSQISIFKGLEADVVLVVLGAGVEAKNVANALYVQGSRAKHVLYVYRRE